MVIMEDPEDSSWVEAPKNRAQAWFRVVLWVLPGSMGAGSMMALDRFQREIWLASIGFGPSGGFLRRAAGSLSWVRWIEHDHLILGIFAFAIVAGWCDTRLRHNKDRDWGITLLRILAFVVVQLPIYWGSFILIVVSLILFGPKP